MTLSLLKDDDPPSDLPPPASPQRDTATLRVLPFPSPSRATAIFNGIGSTVAGVIGALSPHHAAPSGLVGALPFDISLIDSTISTTSNDNDGTIPAAKETADTIMRMFAEDRAEEGDGSNSNVEGGEVNLHYDAMMSVNCWLDEHIRLLANDLDIDEWGEVSAPPIPSAPDGWIPPGATIHFLGYIPKLDAPAHFADVDNPSHWNDFVFQPKYAVEKGRKGEKKTIWYVGHTTPAGAKVVPANKNGICEVNGWKFYYLGWEPDEFDAATFVRATANRECLKLADWKGCLDADCL
jgi:hypothetical protein